MPLHQSILLSATGLVACGAVFMVLPVPVHNPAQLWPFGMCTVVFTFMCVRGRTGYAWLGVILLIASSVAWATVTGQGPLYGFAESFANVGPVLMSTVFALTIRPRAKTIFELRQASTERIAAGAATSAVIEERRRPTRQTQTYWPGLCSSGLLQACQWIPPRNWHVNYSKLNYVTRSERRDFRRIT